MRRKEAGRRVVCSMHLSLVIADSGVVWADEQILVSRNEAWRRKRGADRYSGRPHEQGAGLVCQFDVVSKALRSSAGSKPQQCCETPLDQPALQATLEAAHAAVGASWLLVTPQKSGLEVSCRPYEASAIGAKMSYTIIGNS